MDDPQRALQHLEAVRSLVESERGGLDAAMTDVAIGNMLVALGKEEEAVAAYEHALHRQREVLGPEHETVASTLAAIAAAWVRAGKVEEAKVSSCACHECHNLVLELGLWSGRSS